MTADGESTGSSRGSAEATPPHESYGALFLRFLRFGLLAWGGPVAQIAMIQRELVEAERWISRERFMRTLAVYQVLPGPEAHELCVYFGMLARGRLGGLLAGLGFMLPGFLLMFALSWLYVTIGLTYGWMQAIFAGFQASVVALIVRAVHRIGGHALHDGWLVTLALAVFVADLLGVHFAISLVVAGLAYELIKRDMWPAAIGLGILSLAGVAVLALASAGQPAAQPAPQTLGPGSTAAALPAIFLSGLRSGLLTFGGAYTVIPFLQHDAVEVGRWMTTAQFLDGIALSGILPAPLIIFSTFVGYIAGGASGALLMTVGIFLPAFAFTLVGHDLVQRIIENKAIHTFLDGVTAGVVGLIAATTLELLRQSIVSLPAALIFALALLAVYLWRARAAVAGIVLGSGLLGLLLFPW